MNDNFISEKIIILRELSLRLEKIQILLGVFKLEKGCVTLLWPKIAVLPGQTENWN